jgi:hypothetical protein
MNSSNKTLKNIKGNNSRRVTSKYKNMGKNISKYQDKLRAILNKNEENNINNNININNSKKSEILEKFGISINEITKIVKDVLKKSNRHIIYCTADNGGGFRGCPSFFNGSPGSCTFSNIFRIMFVDNHGFKYGFQKRMDKRGTNIYQNKLKNTIFLQVSGFYMYNKNYEISSFNDINTILELPKSIAISPDILDFIKKKIGCYYFNLLENDVNLNLINHLYYNKN